LICSDKVPIAPNQTESHESRPLPNVQANIYPGIPQAEIPVGKPHSEGAEQIIPRIMENRKFSYSDLQRITNDFKINIGTGGYGSVYLGYLNGFQVAVKMLSQSSTQGVREFLAEVITRTPPSSSF
jgi:hypothetical protein